MTKWTRDSMGAYCLRNVRISKHVYQTDLGARRGHPGSRVVWELFRCEKFVESFDRLRDAKADGEELAVTDGAQLRSTE